MTILFFCAGKPAGTWTIVDARRVQRVDRAQEREEYQVQAHAETHLSLRARIAHVQETRRNARRPCLRLQE